MRLTPLSLLVPSSDIPQFLAIVEVRKGISASELRAGDSTLDFREAVTRNNDDEGKDDSAEKRPKIF